VAILGLLLVRSSGTVWVAYVVTAMRGVGISVLSNRRDSATVPAIVPREQLMTANAISTGTWSAMLAIGARSAAGSRRGSGGTPRL
jgi:hypothetical protein